MTTTAGRALKTQSAFSLWANRHRKWVLAAPAMVFVALLIAFPLGWTLYLSFTDAAGSIRAPHDLIGFENYIDVLSDTDRFWPAVARTAFFTVGAMVVEMVLGMLIALLLVRVVAPVRIVLMTGLVLVWAMPAVVAVQVWYWMTNFQNGVLNHILTQLHVGDYDQHDWYATTFSKLAMVTLLIVWGALPFVAISLYAGLAQVPPELVEAAEIDGAGPLRVFRDITFPTLKPIVFILTSLSIIWDFGVFTQPYLLIGSAHVDSSNYLMGVYVYIEGYAHSDFGRGAAISMLMLLIDAALSDVYVRGKVRMEEIT